MDDPVLRRALVTFLTDHVAHITMEQALVDVPREIRGGRPDGFVHSIWELLEHVRLAQEDILQYALDPTWVSPEWPVGYWPQDPPEDVSDGLWAGAVEGFRRDLAATVALVEDRSVDLMAQIPHARKGHTYLREVLLIVDHNAYHAAQVVDLRRAQGAWSG